ncbi:uncharacterized protein LOC120330353 isoform X2 [Styela clava]
MSVVHTFKSGKQVIMENGVTRIVKRGKGETAANDGQVKSDSTSYTEGTANEKPNNASPMTTSRRGTDPMPQPTSYRATPNANVKNQINILGGNISQLSIGNQGSTSFNQKTEQYNAGAQKTDYNFHGGDFTQANICGSATYNNKDCGFTKGAKSDGTEEKKMPEKDSVQSDGVVEKQVIEILTKGMTSEHFLAILKKGLTITEIHASVSKLPKVNDVLVKSMLRYDASEIGEE